MTSKQSGQDDSQWGLVNLGPGGQWWRWRWLRTYVTSLDPSGRTYMNTVARKRNLHLPSCAELAV